MKTSQNGFIAFLQDLFKDERGSTSIKPVIALMGSLFLCITMLLNSYTHEQFKPADNLVNAVVIITAIGMGADSLDKFSFKPKSTDVVSSETAPQSELKN
jgi:hypothetical protein